MIGVRARLAVATLAVVGGGIAGASSSGATPIGPECFGDTNGGVVCVTVDTDGLPTVQPDRRPSVRRLHLCGPTAVHERRHSHAECDARHWDAAGDQLHRHTAGDREPLHLLIAGSR